MSKSDLGFTFYDKFIYGFKNSPDTFGVSFFEIFPENSIILLRN